MPLVRLIDLSLSFLFFGVIVMIIGVLKSTYLTILKEKYHMIISVDPRVCDKTIHQIGLPRWC